jgi:hypothetical protein
MSTDQQVEVQVSRLFDGGLDGNAALFRVDDVEFRVPLGQMDSREGRILARKSRLGSAELELRQQMRKLARVVSLSVLRFDEQGREEVGSPYAVHRASLVDRKLRSLMGKLTAYQVELLESVSGISQDFQHQVLLATLFDPAFDSFDIDTLSEDLLAEQDQLVAAFRDLGVWNTDTGTRVRRHISALRASLAKVREFQKGGSSVAIDDFMPLPLLRRTQHIIDLSRQAAEEKRAIMSPLEEYLATVRTFITDKEIVLADDGGLSFRRSGVPLDIDKLSSGEKQLIIFLTEALLQRGRVVVFVADEPELSLHIEWQSKLIDAVLGLNPNAQIIVATHSPEIAGRWHDSVLAMEDLVYG